MSFLECQFFVGFFFYQNADRIITYMISLFRKKFYVSKFDEDSSVTVENNVYIFSIYISWRVKFQEISSFKKKLNKLFPY